MLSLRWPVINWAAFAITTLRSVSEASLAWELRTSRPYPELPYIHTCIIHSGMGGANLPAGANTKTKACCAWIRAESWNRFFSEALPERILKVRFKSEYIYKPSHPHLITFVEMIDSFLNFLLSASPSQPPPLTVASVVFYIGPGPGATSYCLLHSALVLLWPVRGDWAQCRPLIGHLWHNARLWLADGDLCRDHRSMESGVREL